MEICKRDPNSGKILYRISGSSTDQVIDIINLADQKQNEWKSLELSVRQKYMTTFLKILRGEIKTNLCKKLETTIQIEVGKMNVDVQGEIHETSEIIEYFLKTCSKVLKDHHIEIDKSIWPTKKSILVRNPVGVVGIIGAWNYPLEMAICSIIPALLCGNTVVFKPSELSLKTGLVIEEMFKEAKLPKGVFNILIGKSNIGKMIVSNAKVNLISFVGSREVGLKIGRDCSRNLKRHIMELGGSDPAIVSSNVDLDFVVNGLVWGCFNNAGQVCSKPKRIFVHEGIYQQFIACAKEKIEGLRLGVDIGPLITLKALRKIEKVVRTAIDQGARLEIGGTQNRINNGYFFEPTLLSEIKPDMEIFHSEYFGPIMAVAPYSDVENVISLANNTCYGLGASIWSNDQKETDYISRKIKAGMIWINDVNLLFPQAPWQGIKQSGFRFLLTEQGLLEFTQSTHISFEKDYNSTSREWWFSS